MRIGGHQTFHLRDAWLYKGLSFLSKESGCPLSAEDLGVGKNMAESIGYWLHACQLTSAQAKNELSTVGGLIFKHDPFLELDGTLLLVHYLMASNEDQATAWFWFFNKLGVTEFDLDTLEVYFSSFVEKTYQKKVKSKSIRRELQCLLHTYLKPAYDERVTPETESPSPFVRFEIVSRVGDRFHKNAIDARHIDPRVFAYILYLFWSNNLSKPKSLSFEEITKRDGSPGRILGISEDQCSQIIESIEREFGDRYLTSSRTGGYFMVVPNEKNIRNAMTDFFRENAPLLGD